MKINYSNRNKVDYNPIRTKCTYCGHVQLVTEDNTELLFTSTKLYWCEKCGEQYLQELII